LNITDKRKGTAECLSGPFSPIRHSLYFYALSCAKPLRTFAGNALKQPQRRQLLPQFRWQGSPARFTGSFIMREFIFVKIAPPLKRATRLPLGRNDLRLQNEMTTIDALFICKRAHVQQALTALDITFDNPVERTAFQ